MNFCYKKILGKKEAGWELIHAIVSSAVVCIQGKAIVLILSIHNTRYSTFNPVLAAMAMAMAMRCLRVCLPLGLVGFWD